MRRCWLIAFVLLSAVAAGAVKEDKHIPSQSFKIVSVGTRTEDLGGDTDSVIISWKVVVESKLTAERKPYGQIKYFDSDGYEVDGDTFGGCIAGGEQRTFTGQTPMPRKEEDRIATAKAEILDDFPCD